MTRRLTLETFATIDEGLARCLQLRRNGGPLQIWPISYPGGYLVVSFGEDIPQGRWLCAWLRVRAWCAAVTGYTHERWKMDEDERERYL